jgi:chemotaxis protein histidine kinase CheA
MSDNDTDATTPADDQRVSQLLSDIAAIKDRAEAAAGAAEVASSKANSESGFAFNAKQYAEEHAKAISQVRGSVDADFNWLTTTKTNAEEAAQAIGRAKVSAESDGQTLAKAKSSAEQDASLAAAARERADHSVSVSESYQNALGPLWTRANEDAANVTQAKATVEASATAVLAIQAQVAERAAKAESDASTIAVNDAASKAVLQTMTEAATTANQVQEHVVQYEKELELLKKQFDELRAKTEALLPGATSAGLASAFRDQKARFDRPQRYWLWTFIVAVVLLLIAGSAGLPGFLLVGGVAERPSWDIILRHVVNRLPLVLPLVWLGLYAGRNYMLALRMLEDYAFKEAISATFEGYKREMAAISGGEPGALPLVKLCENVLLTLAERPGRIYESHQEDITPFAPVAKVLADAAGPVTKAIGEATAKMIEAAAKTVDKVKGQ